MTAPTLTDLNPVTLNENDVSATPQIIDADVTLTDVEGDMANGSLRVHGLAADDIISLFNEGVGAGQIGFNSTTGEVTWGGLLIGVATGGVGADFTIAFNGDATLAAVEAVIEHLTYANLSDHPTHSRTLTIDVTDGAGQTTGSVHGYSQGVFSYSLGGGPALQNGAVAAYDIDGGGTDLVFVNQDGGFSFFQNTGSGFAYTPLDFVDIDTPLAAGSNIAFGDMNYDGYVDLVAIAPDGTVRLFWNMFVLGEQGNMTFAEADANFSATLNNALALTAGSSLAFADFNKDGLEDIVVVDGAGQITTRMNYLLYGAGYETVWTASVTATGRPTLADLTGDGFADLIVAGQDGQVSLGVGDGMGGFDFSGANPLAGWYATAPASTVALDLNGDGARDVLVYDQSGFIAIYAPPPITNTLTIGVTDQPGTIAIDGLPASLTFEEDVVSAAPQLLFPNLTLTDTEQDLANGVVQIGWQTGADILSFQNQGTDPGQVTVVGNEIYVGGELVASWYLDDSFMNLPFAYLQINFQGASPAAVEAVLESLTYANTSNTPPASQLALYVYDGQYNPVVQQVIDLTINDNPEQMSLFGLYGSHRINVTDAADPVLIAMGAAFEDGDGDFDGSVFTVSGLAATDRITLTPDASVSLAGGVVTVDGVAIGLAAGGQGGDFTVTLNPAATSAALQALIRTLTFTSPGAVQGDRTLTLSMIDQGGHALTQDGSPVTVNLTLFQQGDIQDLAATLDLTLAEAATPHRLDADVTVLGPPVWNQGSLAVSGLTDGDVIGLAADAGFSLVDDKGTLYVWLDGRMIGALGGDPANFTVYLYDAAGAEVAALVEALTFANTGTPDAARILTLTLTDPGGLVSHDRITVNVAGGTQYSNTIIDLATDVFLSEFDLNMGFALLDPQVTLRDTVGDYSGSVLTVSGAVADDILGLAFGMDVPDYKWQSQAGQITFGPDVIATVSGGMNGQPLIITFASGTTTAQVETVIEHLAMRTDDNSPEVSRYLTLSLQNAAGEALHRNGDSGSVVVYVNVSPSFDPTEYANIGFNGSFTENDLNSEGVRGFKDMTISADGPLYSFSFRITGLTAEDSFSLRTGDGVTFANGTISFNGVQVGYAANQGGSEYQVGFFSWQDAAVIQAVLRQIVFKNGNDDPSADSRVFNIFYGAQGDERLDSWKFTIEPGGEQTDLTGVPTGATFDEQTVNAGPQALVTEVTHDLHGETLEFATLTVSGLAAGDVVTLLSGPALTFDDTTGAVTVNGVLVAQATVTPGTGLVVTFNAAATAAASEAVIEALAYSTPSDTPALTRTLLIDLVNRYGHHALDAGGHVPAIEVTVTPFHEPMLLTGLPAGLSFAEDALNLGQPLLTGPVDLFSPDSRWTGGALTVSSGDAADQFYLVDTARVTVLMSAVLVDGQLIGSLQSAGSSLFLLFSSEVPADAIEQILAAITYRNTDDAPAASHPVTLTLIDAQGYSSETDIEVQITAQDDAPTVYSPSHIYRYENDLQAGDFVLANMAVTDTDGFTGSRIVLTGFLAEDAVSLYSPEGQLLSADIHAGAATFEGVGLTFGVDGSSIVIDMAGGDAATVEALLRNIFLTLQSDRPASFRQIGVSIVDASGQSGHGAVAFSILPNYDPASFGPVSPVTFGEEAVNAAPQLLVPDITFTAPDGIYYAAIVIEGLQAGERITLLDGDGLTFDTGTGVISVDGVPVANLTLTYLGPVIALLQNGPPPAIDRADAVELILQHLAFSASSDTPPASHDLTISIQETPIPYPADYVAAEPVTVTVNITPFHDAPKITGFGPATLSENAVNFVAQQIDNHVTVVAPDSASFAGGSLTVTSDSAEDVLTLDAGNPSVLDVVGGAVTVNGVAVATVLDAGQGIALTLNGNATAEAVEVILEALRLSNADNAPDETPHQLTVTLSDSTGAASQTLVEVTIQPQDDPTVLSGVGDVTLQENTLQAGGQLLFPHISLTDPDGAAGDFILIGGLPPEFTLGLQAHGGDAAVPTLIPGNLYSYAGFNLGVFSTGPDLVIRLSGASMAQTQTILANLLVSNPSDQPAPGFTLDVRIATFSGLLDFTHAVTVEPQFDPITLTGVTASHTFDEQLINTAPQLLDTDVTITSVQDQEIARVVVSGLSGSDLVTLLNDAHFVWDRDTGRITLDGMQIGSAEGGAGADLNIAIAGASPAEQAANAEIIIEHLAYANAFDAPAASRTLTIEIIPIPAAVPDYAAPAPVSVTVNITPFYDPPTVSGLDAITVGEQDLNFGLVLVDSPVTVFAFDTSSFDGGQLTLTSSVLQDQFLIYTEGSSINATGSNILDGGVEIASSWSQSAGQISFTLTGAASWAAIERLIETLSLRNTDDTPDPNHVLTLTLSDSTGAQSSQQIAVTVVPFDDPAYITTVPADLHEAALNTTGETLFQSFSFFDPEFVGDEIVISYLPAEFVLSLPAQGGDAAVGDLRTAGTFTYAGIQVTAASPDPTGPYVLQIDGASAAQVQTLLSAILVQSASNQGIPATTFSFDIIGQDGSVTGGPINQVYTVAPQFDPTTLTGVTASLTVTEQAPAQLIDGDITLTQIDGGPITGLQITGLLPEDRVSLLGDADFVWNTTTGEIFYGGDMIGYAMGAAGGTFSILVFGFDQANRHANAEAILERLTYANVSDTPTASHTLTIQVIENQAGIGDYVAPAPVQVTVNVTPSDDPTVLLSSGHEPVFNGLTPQSFAGGVSLVDPDGPVPNLDGAVLRVTGLAAAETVSLLSTVGGTGAFLQAGGVWVGGVLVGQASGGTGSDFVVTFNAAATGAAVNTIIHQMGWSSTVQGASDHTLQLSLTPVGGSAWQTDVDFHVIPPAPPAVGNGQLFNVVSGGYLNENTANAGFTSMNLAIAFDPDVVYANATLNVQLAYALPAEALGVINQGTGPGQVGYTKTADVSTVFGDQVTVGGQRGVVTYEGVEVAAFVTDSNYNNDTRVAQFVFNANATAEAVEAVVHALAYTTTSDAPPEMRQVNVVLSTSAYSAQVASVQVENGAIWTVTQQNMSPYYQSPNFVDLDGDGDLDVLFARDWDSIGVLRNIGTAQNPQFQYVTGTQSDVLAGYPNDSVTGRSAMLTTGDLDGDGDIDLVSGGVDGTITFLENTGGPGALNAFVARTGAANPFDGLDFNATSQRLQTSPSLADLDGDGDLDLLVGTPDGHLRHYENTGTKTAAVFTERHGFDAITVLAGARPWLGDIDGDGDIDLMVATDATHLAVYENLGSGVFDATARPYASTVAGGYTTYRFNARLPLDQAVLTDLNGDGVAELYTADYLQYLRLLTPPTSLIAPYQVGGFWFFVVNEPEYIYGTPGDDTINGDARDTIIYGYAGADTIDGKAGADTLHGGIGNDTYIVDPADIVIELDGEGTDTIKASFTYVLGDFVENLTQTGSAAINGTGNGLNNVILGNAGANSLWGLDGNDNLNGGAGIDILYGGAGDDILNGGLGVDRMVGGLGNDTYVVDGAGEITDESDGDGIDLVQSSVTWTLAAGIENLTLTGKTATQDGTGNELNNVITGNAYVNTLTGNAGADTLLGMAGEDILVGGDGDDILDGGLGADVMLGGFGNDTYIIDNVDDFAVEVGGGGIDTIQSKISWTMGLGIENLIFTVTGAVDGTGNAVNNVITGNLSNNRLSGMGGDDTLTGFAGNDILDGGDGNDLLDGGAGIDVLTGGAGTDMLIGGDGNDSLDGGTGADHMDGGLGNDAYFVDSLGDVLVDAGGVDTVNASISYNLDTMFENLTLTGAADIYGQGNALANTVIGNSGANFLYGEAGIDTLSGMAGNDNLYGGAGIDTLLGGDGNDMLVGGADADKLTGGAGADLFWFSDLDVRLTTLGLVADRDSILDLNFADGDRLDLSGIDANTLLAGDQAFVFAAKFTKVAGQATLKFASGITTLALDVDGDGKADFNIAITGDHSLTTGNLYGGGGDPDGGWIL